METVRCKSCGETIGEDEIFCPFCDDGLDDDQFAEYDKAMEDYTHHGPNHRT